MGGGRGEEREVEEREVESWEMVWKDERSEVRDESSDSARDFICDGVDRGSSQTSFIGRERREDEDKGKGVLSESYH